MRRVTVTAVSKTFVLHNQGGIRLPVLNNVSMHADAGEIVVLSGVSGCGKSSLLKILYGNYLADSGSIVVSTDAMTLELVGAHPHQVLECRATALGFVSQFLRVIPRVSTWDLVAEPLRRRGVEAAEVSSRTEAILKRLNLPERLWSLAPATFSGGEQQRVNIARSMIVGYPVLLLDEPTASLDAVNRDVVAEMIVEARDQGTALIGIFHDDQLRNRLADRLVSLEGGTCV